MRITLNDRRGANVGSTRIWIQNLHSWLRKLGEYRRRFSAPGGPVAPADGEEV